MQPLLRAAVTLLAFFTLSGVAVADDVATLKTLRQEQASIFSIVREFHMQTLLSGDPARTAQLKSAIDKGQRANDNLPGKTGNAALDAAVAQSRGQWATFAKLAAANNIAKDGYTDDNLIGELYDAAEALTGTLGTAIGAIPGGKNRALADRVHAANLLMQRTVASYLKRGAQMSPDVGSEDPFDVGEATKKLDQQIQTLARDLKGDEAMRTVQTKWNFIRGSLANYNEKTVPFIIDRYATQINDGLLQVAANVAEGK